MHRAIFWSLVGLLLWSARGVADEPENVPRLEVKLIHAGEEPRRELRYKFKRDAHEEMVMSMKMGMATEIAGQKLPTFQVPTMEMTMTADVKDIQIDKINYAFELSGAKLLDDENVPEPVSKAMTDSLMKVIGLGGESTLNDRGRTLSAKMNVPESAPADVRQILDGMQRSMQNVGAPMPDEPVGVGAVWEVQMDLELNGMQITQVATYTLKKLTSDSIDTDLTMKQSAKKQQMKLPNLPPGTSVELQSLDGHGSGSMTLSFDRLVPKSKLELVTVTDAVITTAGMEQPMKSSTSVVLGVRPK